MKKTSSVLWIFRRLRNRIPALILLTLSHIANALLIVAFSLGSSRVIDTAVSGDTSAFIRACLLQASIILGILLTLTFNRSMHDRLDARLDMDWKQKLLHGMLHGDYAEVSAFHSGELLNRLNNDVRIINNSILATLPNLASMLTKLIAAIAVLVALEPLFSLIVVAAGVLVILSTSVMRKHLKGLHKQVSQHDGRVFGFLQETLEKLLMVQSLDVAGEMEHRADDLMQKRFVIQMKRKNIALTANTCISIMAYGAGFGALVWCSGGLLNGTISFGTLTAITQLVGHLQAPFVNLSGIIPQYIAMTAAAERLIELEAISGEPPHSKDDPKEVYSRMSGIGADNLCFAYDRDRVFDEADFLLPKGQFGVIVGHSGIGKSTLLKLMLGIFHPQKGQLFASTEDGDIPLDRSTRGLFAYVPQGNLLISGTLRENLLLTRPEATEEEIQQAIHISAMDDFLPSLPMGLDTVLGEGAAGLSEGQAQRLSIARAILSQAPVLLLDEATSALDADTEVLVLKRLRDTGKTCIAVTHRPAAIAISNWKLEVKNGKCTLHQIQ